MGTTGGSRRRVGLAVLAVLAAVAAAVLTWAFLAARDQPEGYTSRDLDGNTVVWDRAPDVAGSRVRPTGLRFRAPVQGLSVPLESAVVTGGVINPPSLTSAFLMRDFGRPGVPRSGQVVVALHSVHDGRGPGNAFFDMTAPEGVDPVLVSVGDPLLVGPARYRVTRTLVEAKSAAAADPRLWDGWASRRGSLLVLTCLQRSSGSSGSSGTSENLVILAQSARPPRSARTAPAG
ncbi:MAG TPA: hypothetical protein PLP61_10210 [Nocardioides sp.]|uniref:hypothetical protein n=1 Tax=Nocardioides sp. TaxID=35761 RepID=UPI002C9818BC|nr:hypothetical protein [Nocardioides sp.]HQR27399.1 hypothetical protein [Nocardioides sp.]